MPNRYSWNKLSQPAPSTFVTPRSGHTLTATSHGYVCFGGIDGRKNEKGHPVPNNDLYLFTVRGQEYSWSRPQIVSDSSTHHPPVRTLHSATRIDDSRVFVFGGLHCSSPYKVLNDGWLLDMANGSWSRNIDGKWIGASESAPSSSSSPVVRKSESKANKKSVTQVPLGNLNGRKQSLPAKVSFQDRVIELVSSMADDQSFPGVVTAADSPAPRSGHTCSLVGCDSVVLFGGWGGFGFSRRHLNDVHVFSFISNKWESILCTGNPPSARSGHGSAATEGKMYIFGGWNSETQFNDLFVLDVATKDWSDLDLSWSSPRWNLSMTLVKGLPNDKIFVFGGCVEGEGRSLGILDNVVGVLDLAKTMTWDEPVVEEPSPIERSAMLTAASKLTVPPANPFVPSPRESAAVVYDEIDSRLIVFGGWSNKWMDDVWAIDVSAIIGPPYAVNSVTPC